MSRHWLCSGAVFCLLFGIPVALNGQTPQAPAAPALQAPGGQTMPAPGPYQAPALRFEPTGMTLLDAVKLTLEHDPTIKLRQADVDVQQGVVRSQKGLFDSVFRAGGSFNRNQSALLASQRLDLQQTRDDLAGAIGDATVLTNSLTAAGSVLADKNQVFANPAAMNLSAITDPTVLTQMSLLQSELVLYHDILASPMLTDPAVRNDIVNLREQTIGKNLDYFNSEQAEIAGVPGQLQTKLDNLGGTPAEQWAKDSQVTADVTKLFRSGLVLHPYLSLDYTSQNYVGKSRVAAEFGGLGVQPASTGRIGFDVVLPILRGRGRDSVAAAETAAKYDLDASRLELLFQQSQSVLSTIQAYWQVRADADRVEVLRRSVEIQGELGNVTRALIAANERPVSDEARVEAATADARGQYEAAQRQLTDSRITLAQAMGVTLADALSLPLAADPYPQPPPDLQMDPQAYAAFVAGAVSRRFDRQAALKSEESGKVLLEGARIDRRPLLNLTASGWGTSVQEQIGYRSWAFRSGSMALSLERPLGNNTAGGLYDQREAALNLRQIDSANLARQIGLNVIQLSESLRIAADRLRAAQEAVRNYDQTMTTEQQRLRSGDASLVDTILTEQQSTGARLTYIGAEQDYASLLATLRHEAGLLVQDGSVDVAQLVTVPAGLLRR